MQETWCLTPLGDAQPFFRASVSPSVERRHGTGSPGCSSPPCGSSPVPEEAARAACVRGASGPSSQPRGTGAVYLLLLLPLRCWTESRLLHHTARLAGSLLTKRRILSGSGQEALGSQLLLATGPVSPRGGGFWGHAHQGAGFWGRLHQGAELWGRCTRCWGQEWGQGCSLEVPGAGAGRMLHPGDVPTVAWPLLVPT